MWTFLRRLIGALLALQCAGMLCFDIWLFSGGIDLSAYTAEEQAVIIGVPIAEGAGIALGLWLVSKRARKRSMTA